MTRPDNTNKVVLAFVVTFATAILLCDAQEEGPFSFLLQSCLYLAHYVRDNYVVLEPYDDTSPPSPGDVNWATWTNMAAEARYLPPQLTQGLIACGKQYAFYALRAPAWLVNHYNLTASDIIG